LLPNLVLPGKAVPAAILVGVPPNPGAYRVVFRVERASAVADRAVSRSLSSAAEEGSMRLVVAARSLSRPAVGKPIVEMLEGALAAAEGQRRLPDDYLDVTEGRLAGWKRRIKAKLLNNLRRAYVDPAFRQQSAFNQQMMTALRELVQWCATLDHAVEQSSFSREPQASAPPKETSDTDWFPYAALVDCLVDQVTASEARCRKLEERLDRLEGQLLKDEEVGT
jgi:hypothetical protein